MLPQEDCSYQGDYMSNSWSAALTWFLWTWNSKVFVSMLMLDRFPNGNLGGKTGKDLC